MEEASDDIWEELWHQAQIFATSRDGTRLESVASRLQTMRPELALGHYYRSLAQQFQDKPEEALPTMERALALAPDEAYLHVGMAILLRAKKDFERAKPHLDEALSRSPESADYWRELAALRHVMGEREAATEALDHSLQLDPEDSDALYLAACVAEDDEDVPAEDVIAHYESALALHPEDARLHYGLGIALWGEGERGRAEDQVRRALRLDPEEMVYRDGLLAILSTRSKLFYLVHVPWVIHGAYWYMLRDLGVFTWIVFAISGLALLIIIPGMLISVFYWPFCYPLERAWKYFVLADLRAEAGEVGARRGGPFGFHGWPLLCRMLVFLTTVGLFWFGVWQLLHTILGALVFVVGLLVAAIMTVAVGLFGDSAKAVSAPAPDREPTG